MMKILTNTRFLSGIILLLSALAPLSSAADAPAIRHRFLAVDESRTQLLLVDQFQPEKAGRFPCRSNAGTAS